MLITVERLAGSDDGKRRWTVMDTFSNLPAHLRLRTLETAREFERQRTAGADVAPVGQGKTT